MNDEYLKKLYGWIKSNDSSYGGKFSYEQFSNKMEDEVYVKKMHGWVKGIDPNFFSLEDFNSRIKKKSQAENGGSTSAVGLSVSPKTDGDYTYGDNESVYRKQGENWLINNESTGGQYVDLKDPTGSRAKELNRNARKMSSLDIKSEQASKEISKTKDLSNVVEADSEIFTGYPGKEKNKYEFKDGSWYEPNPEVEKTIQRETEKRKSLVGTAYEKTIAININNAIKDIPKTRVIKDDARVKALNKQFGKNASLDEYYETFGDYDNSPEKKDNKYRIKDNSWQRLVPGATEYSTITNEGSINALNRRYGKNIDAKKNIVVKPKEIDPFLKVNSNFLAQSEESAQEMLEKNFKSMGFTFEQTGVGGDYIKVTPNNGNEPRTFSFNNVGNSTRGAFSSPTGMGIGNNNSKELEKNVDQSVKLQAYLRFNASAEKEDDLSAVNLIKSNTSRGKAAYVDPNNFIENNKYYESEDYKNAFKELTFQQKKNEIREREREAVNLSIADGDGWLMESINEYVFGDTPNAKARKERLLKAKQTLYKSEEYKLYKDEQKKYDAQIGQKYDKLHDELIIAKQSGNKEAIKTVKTKIEGGYSKDLIGDNLNHMTNTQYDLQRDINNFNKRKEKLQLDAKNGNLTQEQYNDAVEGLSSEAQRLDVAAKNVAATQKKMNALAGIYATEKAKSGGFFGNFTNEFVVAMDEVREPLSYIFPLIGKDLSGDEAREISLDSKIITPQQRQYYKDKGFSDEQIKNVFLNNAQKNAIAANKRAIIETFGSDLTTEESKQNLGFVEQALVGVAASLPSMLTRAVPIVGAPLAFASMANMSYNAINEEMLNDTDFETTSEADRAVVAVPYALVMGYLENVGLRYMTSGKSTLLAKAVLSTVAKAIPFKAGREVAEKVINREVKSLIGKGAIKIVNGTLVEGETGFYQAALLDVGLKQLYNKLDLLDLKLTNKEGLTGGELFETPDTKMGVAGAILEGAAAEAIGGFAMSTVMTGSQLLINGKISLYNEEDLKFFKDFSSDQEFKKLIVSNLKTQMLNGTMTKGEAQSALNDINLVEGVFNSIDENISDEAKLIAFNLINERNRLEKEVVGKDPALSKEKNDRIKDINDKLGTLPLQVLYENNIERATELETALKQKGAVIINGEKINRKAAQTELNQINQKVKDAVQKQAAGQVPVQPTTTVGEEVVQGEPTAESQVLTEEGQKIKVEDIESKRIETEAKIKRKDLFSNGGSFSNTEGGSGVDSVPTGHSEINGIEFVQFSNPNTGEVDVVMTGKSDNDFVGFYRIYENGKATNKWSSKFENQSRNKEDFKTMIGGVQSMLPQGHEYTEKTSISTDGLRLWNQQLNRGYELQYDNNGNLITNRVAINGDAIINDLGVEVNKGNFDNISVKNSGDMKKVKAALLPYLQNFGLNESNIHFENGTVEIDLPVLKNNKVSKTTTEGKAEEVVPLTLEEELQLLAEEKVIAPTLEAPTLETPVVEATPQEQVAAYRAEEQAELLKAIPKIESYKVKGKIDKTKMPKTVLAKYNKIYEKYNALISPLLPAVKTKAPVVKAPVTKAAAPKKQGDLPVLSWSNVDRYKDDVIRAMREIQNKLLTPLLALKYNTTPKQKKQIIDIRAKIALADKILKRNFDRAKREQAKIEKEKNTKTPAKVTPAITSVKALFESNPELANEVYEALGIKDNVVTKTNKKIDFDKLDKKWSDKILNILKEKYPEVSFEFTEDTIQFIDDPMVFMQLSNKMYTEFKRLLTKKRPDLAERGLIEMFLDDISKLSDEFGTKENKTRLEKLTLHWMINGNVILPEDGAKVVEAEKIASKKKLDAFSYSSPNEIIEKFAEESKKEKVDPDTLSSFTNKKEIGDGIVIYDVENSDKGQEQARIVLDTHFGEKSNPWCLLYKDADGSLTRAKEHWFGTYSGDKKIAFQNGKLIAFYGGDLWWDRLDNSSDGIPIVRKIKDDSLKRKQLIVVDSNDANKIISYGNKTLGNEQNGEYKVWDKNDNLRTEANFKNGDQDGKTIEYDSNGQIEMESNFKNGLANGKTILYYYDGQMQMESNFKNGEQDGKEIRYYDNGQINVESTYKDNKLEGEFIRYYMNGQLKSEQNYKNGKLDGKWIKYQDAGYKNGELLKSIKTSEESFKDGEQNGKSIDYYWNGKVKSESNYKDDKKNGESIEYYENGQLSYETNFKDGLKEGKSIDYYENGQIRHESNYKDGVKVGKSIGYDIDGQIESEENYKDGRRDGKVIEYYENRQIKYETNFKDGLKEGKSIDYYENGQILGSNNYKDGKLDGKSITYNIDGWIEFVTNYKDGKLDGKFIKYNKDGKVESESNYKDGRGDEDWRNFQRNKENEIIGQANTKAMTVLVNALKQKKDTIPHEYAHIYIAMFRDTPIVQEGIKRFGSEEKLVQAIGEQVVQQKGEAYNWWKKFTNFILKIMSDQQVVQVLTDSFLERADLTTYNYTKYSKAQAQNLFSDYIKQNPSGDIDGFREFVFEKQTKAPVVEAKAEPVKKKVKVEAEPVKEAPAPAKESTDDLMGAINSIKEDIKKTTEEIEKARAEAKEKIKQINAENIDLDDLEADIKEIQDDLKKDLDGLKLDLDRHVKALKEEVKKLEDLDAKNPENKKTLLSYLDAAIKTLNGLNSNNVLNVKVDAGFTITKWVTVGVLKKILQGIRLGVIAGNTINASIKKMAIEYRGKHKNKKITIAEFTKEIEEYLRNTFVDQKTNEQDIQEARAKFVEIREAVRKAKLAVKTESKTLRANAENAIREMLKGKVKNLSAVQMKSIMLRLARFNVFSQTQYDKFINYVDKVIGIADYDKKVNDANENRKNAKKNTIGNKPKLGDITPDLFRSLSIMLNIDAKLIPRDVFESYSKIVEMLSKRDTVLQLEQRSFLNENVDKIIASIELNDEKISDLKELYDNFEKVKEDGKVDYSGTLTKMLKDDIINQDEYELMKTFKSKIVVAKVKDKMTEQEIADEKAELINEINNTTITLDEIVGDEFRLERELAKRLQVLLKQTDFQNLSNKDLKKLLIIIENINNGFVSNATQLMVEKLNSTKKSIPLATAVHAKITSLYNKMNRFISNTFSRDEFGIAVAPLNLIDEQFGDFETKNIYNSVFKDSAKAQQAFEAEISKIRAELIEIEKSLDKFFGKDRNKKVESKIKMMIYMLQIEKNSNPNSNKVHNAIDILDATIKFSKENSKKSKNSKADLKVLESIRENFVKDEQIDMVKLFSSFGVQEKNALKKLQEINNSMTKKAAYTATVINGNKITTFDNYIFHNTISASDDISVDALVNNISDNMQPTTKSKNLEERGDKALAMNLNPFLAVTVSSRSVLLNYHLTEPIRTARKTLINTIKLLDEEKANGENEEMTLEERKAFEAATKEQYDILNAIKDAYETATKDLLTSNFTESRQLIEWLSRQGYRAVLASAPRAVAELTSNALFVLSAFRKEIIIGFNDNFSLSNSSDAKNILEALGSSLISRLYPEDSLSSVWLDTSAFANRISRDGKMRPKMVNGVLKFHDKYTGRWVDAVSFMADNLIAKPDQAIMRPLWFGSFVNSFKNKTGVEPDFNKIKENDEAYMDEYRDALEEARDVADNNADLTGGNMNPYMSSLQNVIRKEDSFPKVWLKTFQKYMNKFTVKEYYTARKGVRALVGDGDITQKQGALILTGVALRMTIYTTITRLLSEFIMYSFGLGDDDGEEDDDYNAKHIGRKLYQGFTSMLTTLILGRRFGNVVRMAENYFIERANEAYGEDIGLRNGEYDPYEDAVQFNQLQDGKIDKTTDLVKVIAGPYAPAIGFSNLVIKKTRELGAPEAKTERARITKAKEWGRLGLETTGFLGIIPLYKDVRKVFMGYTYKELKKETKETAVKKKAEEIKTALTDSQKISSLKEMRSIGEYTKEEINNAIKRIKDPEYRKAFNDKEEAIKKKILDKYGYENLTDFKRNDEDNYEIEFGDDSQYRIERAESAKITLELKKRMDAIKDGEEYYSTEGATIVAPKKKANKYNRFE